MLSSCFATKDQCNSHLTANAALICQSLLLWKQKLTTVHFILKLDILMQVWAKVPFLTAWRAAKKCLASQEYNKDLSYITKNSISARGGLFGSDTDLWSGLKLGIGLKMGRGLRSVCCYSPLTIIHSPLRSTDRCQNVLQIYPDSTNHNVSHTSTPLMSLYLNHCE